MVQLSKVSWSVFRSRRQMIGAWSRRSVPKPALTAATSPFRTYLQGGWAGRRRFGIDDVVGRGGEGRAAQLLRLRVDQNRDLVTRIGV